MGREGTRQGGREWKGEPRSWINTNSHINTVITNFHHTPVPSYSFPHPTTVASLLINFLHILYPWLKKTLAPQEVITKLHHTPVHNCCFSFPPLHFPNSLPVLALHLINKRARWLRLTQRGALCQSINPRGHTKERLNVESAKPRRIYHNRGVTMRAPSYEVYIREFLGSSFFCASVHKPHPATQRERPDAESAKPRRI